MTERVVINFKKPAVPAVRCCLPRRANPSLVLSLVAAAVTAGAAVLAPYAIDRSVEARASRGEPKALYLLGKRYFDTAMSPHDYIRAARLIGSAAAKGDAAAQTAMGLLYQRGLGVAKNNEQAATWLRRAGDQSYAVAQNELGVMYAKGMGVPRNLSESVRWFARAAAQGSQIAKRNLQLARTVTAAAIPELTTSTKRSYDHAVLRKVESNGITISFQPAAGGWGMAKLKLEDLPSDLRLACKCAAGEALISSSPYSQLKEVGGTL